MLQVGDRVKYRDMVGTIKTVMDDMVIVTLPDGKDYSLPTDAITKESVVTNPNDFSGIITALKPYLKNVNFLTEVAKEMNKAGISDLSIRNGAIAAFQAKESLEEKIAKYKVDALAEAEKKAKEDYERENKAV